MAVDEGGEDWRYEKDGYAPPHRSATRSQRAAESMHRGEHTCAIQSASVESTDCASLPSKFRKVVKAYR